MAAISAPTAATRPIALSDRTYTLYSSRTVSGPSPSHLANLPKPESELSRELLQGLTQRMRQYLRPANPACPFLGERTGYSGSGCFSPGQVPVVR